MSIFTGWGKSAEEGDGESGSAATSTNTKVTVTASPRSVTTNSYTTSGSSATTGSSTTVASTTGPSATAAGNSGSSGNHNNLGGNYETFIEGFEWNLPNNIKDYPAEAAYQAAKSILISRRSNRVNYTKVENLHYRMIIAYGNATAAFELSCKEALEDDKVRKKAVKIIDRAVIRAAHQMDVIGNEPCYCIFCKRWLPNPAKLQVHIVNHLDDGIYRCCYCKNSHQRRQFLDFLIQALVEERKEVV